MTADLEMRVLEVTSNGDGCTVFLGVILSRDPDLYIGGGIGDLWFDGVFRKRLEILGQDMCGGAGGLKSLLVSGEVEPDVIAEPLKCQLFIDYEEGNTPRKASAQICSSVRAYAEEREAGFAFEKVALAEETIDGLTDSSLTEQRVKRRLVALVDTLKKLYSSGELG